MSTKMSEADWDLALDVFRARLPARVAKAKDDRLFLEALRHFTVHNITWRALPTARKAFACKRREGERFGNWNSVWKRFDRLGEAGVFEDYFAMLAGLSGTAHLVQMFDSTVIRAHVSAADAKPSRRCFASSARRWGASRSGARPFARRVRRENPLENRP